jgi:putative colanic acid biosynthesis acetyltransferase WcaF
MVFQRPIGSLARRVVLHRATAPSMLLDAAAVCPCSLLRLFGTRIGAGVVIKPGVRIKFPWLLSLGDRSWIGEDASIDNLARVDIGRNVCISQAAYLCTGNHDWSDPAFGLLVKPIALGDGSWIGARCVVCPGVKIGEGGIAAAGSVVTRDIPAGEIHGGNPATLIRLRRFTSSKARANSITE